MKVWVVTDRHGNVDGVFTKLRRAQACVVSAERAEGALPKLSEIMVNGDIVVPLPYDETRTNCETPDVADGTCFCCEVPHLEG